MGKFEDRIEFLSGKHARFRFRCAACGRCCGRFRIILSPYDIIRLRRGSGSSTEKLIERGTILIARESFKNVFGLAPIADLFDLFGLPQTDVVPIAVMGFRGGTVREPECEFLSALSDDRRVCTIYEDRPTMCRLHPLGCITIGGRRKWFFRQPLCETNYEEEQTVGTWIRESQLGPFLAANGRYLRWMRELLEQCEKFPSISEAQWRALGQIWYNFDSMKMEKGKTGLVLLEKWFHQWLSQFEKTKD